MLLEEKIHTEPVAAIIARNLFDYARDPGAPPRVAVIRSKRGPLAKTLAALGAKADYESAALPSNLKAYDIVVFDGSVAVPKQGAKDFVTAGGILYLRGAGKDMLVLANAGP